MDDTVARLLAIGGALILAALVGLTLLAKKTPAELAPVAPSAAAAPPKAPPPPPPYLFGATPAEADILRKSVRVDPSELYPKAKTRALAWDRNAEFVSLVARRVTGAGVDLTIDGAEATFTFRIPRRPVPTGQTEPPDQFTVTFSPTGVQTTELRTYATGRRTKLEEPTCPFRDAMKNALASGISELSQIDAAFETDKDENRGVWRVGDRVMDGKTCALMRRH